MPRRPRKKHSSPALVAITSVGRAGGRHSQNAVDRFRPGAAGRIIGQEPLSNVEVIGLRGISCRSDRLPG